MSGQRYENGDHGNVIIGTVMGGTVIMGIIRVIIKSLIRGETLMSNLINH
jgi:hypothetical protein